MLLIFRSREAVLLGQPPMLYAIFEAWRWLGSFWQAVPISMNDNHPPGAAIN